ncbi:MAG: TetR/AcrR family transcriptional regulator [Sneathiella sp.]
MIWKGTYGWSKHTSLDVKKRHGEASRIVIKKVQSDVMQDDKNTVRKSERTRQTILNAAAKLFKERGYTATTLRDVADEAGLKAGSIYYHFASKDEIMDEVLDTGLRAVYEAVKAAKNACDDDENYLAMIEACVHAHLKVLFTQGDFVSANIRLYNQLPKEIQERHHTLRREYGNMWDTLLLNAQKAGFLHSDLEIVPARQFILGSLNWTVEWYDDSKYSLEALATRCVSLIARGIYSN